MESYKVETFANPNTRCDHHLVIYQVDDVQSIWEKVRNDRDSIVATIFLRMFSDNPAMQKKYAKLADVPHDCLTTNVDFVKKCSYVADRLDCVIADMYTPWKMQGHVNWIATAHRHGLHGPEFEIFCDHLVDLLKAKGVEEDKVNSWNEIFRVLINAINTKIQGLRKE